MPRLLDTNGRTDELAHVLATLISEHGLEAPSSRRIAAGLRLSIGTLAHHYESRTRLLRVLSYRIGRALMEECAPHLRTQGVGALLREDEYGVLLTRAWLGVVELGRCSEDVGHSLAGVAKMEESHLIIATDYRIRDERSIETLRASIHGLRTATCRYVEPLDTEVARAILTDQVEHLAPASGRL